jgi:hypothetical protein
MQARTYLLTSWLLVAIKTSAQNVDADLFGDVAPDPPLPLNEPSVQELDPLDQTAGLDFNNWFPDGDVQLGQKFEPDSSFFLANDVECDASIADDILVFGRIRRSAVCKPTSAEQAKEPKVKLNDPFNFDEFMRMRPSLADFQESPDSCPARIFGKSNIAVCARKSTQLISEPGISAFILKDVIPGA